MWCQDDEEGEPSSSDDSPETNESSSSAPSGDNDPQAATLIKSLAENNDDATVSNEAETLSSEKSGNADKPQFKEKIIPISKVREQIAASLIESKTQIPHFYLHVELDAEPLMVLIKQANIAAEENSNKLTINDFALKAAASSAVAQPKVNASFDGDAIIQYASVDLSVAIAVDDGLVTPVIRSAQEKSILEISLEVKDLAQRARAKKLSPDEFSGGTLTVSNLGAYGVDSFDAIINPPQSVILSIGGIVNKPVVSKEGQIVPGKRMNVGISCDHRVVDGAVAAEYLAEFKKRMENPASILV